MNTYPSISRKFLVAVALCGVGLALAVPAKATVIIEPFDSPLGGLPTGWVLATNGSSGSVGQIAEFATGDNRLWQSRVTGATNWIYYNGTQGDVVNGQLSDFYGTVVFNTNSSSMVRGIVLRSQTTTYNNSKSYYISLDIDANNPDVGAISLWLNPNDNSATNAISLAKTSSWIGGNLTSNTDYQLAFSAIGDELQGSVYAWNSSTSAYDILRGTVSYTIGTNVNDVPPNGQYSSGYFGFRMNASSNGQITYWNDLQITVVPEPSSLGLLGAALGLLAWRRHRKAVC